MRCPDSTSETGAEGLPEMSNHHTVSAININLKPFPKKVRQKKPKKPKKLHLPVPEVKASCASSFGKIVSDFLAANFDLCEDFNYKDYEDSI